MTYLDHAATTPMLPSALAAMTEQLARVGNASSLHASGRQARRVAEQSREKLAAVLGARAPEGLFTGGGPRGGKPPAHGRVLGPAPADPGPRRVVAHPARPPRPRARGPWP